MSEELNKTEQATTTPATEEKESVAKSVVKKLSRRQALMGALLGAGVAVAKTAEAAEASCACLAAPDCSTICPNGGTPKGDGTQACECNAEAKEQLATVAYTGSYNDLTDKPTLYTPPDVVKSGSAGQNTDQTIAIPLTGTQTLKVPYFTVDNKGRITSFTTHTISLVKGYYNYYNYSDYYNYYVYSDYNCNDAE